MIKKISCVLDPKNPRLYEMRLLIGLALFFLLDLGFPSSTEASPHYVVLTDAHGHVYVDLGSQHGLRPGMHLQVTRDDQPIAQLVVRSADEQFARTTIHEGAPPLPGDQVSLIPSSEPLVLTSKRLNPAPQEEEKPPVSWWTMGKLLSMLGAVGGFYAAHHASQSYAEATTVDSVSRYVAQGDRSRQIGWISVGVGVALVGVHWLGSHLW